MEIIEPWNTVIVKHQLQDQELVRDLVTELTQCPFFAQSRQTGNVLHEEYTPKTIDVYNTFIKPLVLDYLKDVFHYSISCDQLRSNTWGVMLEEGESLEAHTHANGALISILYLTDSDSPIVLTDPRGLACRGYPSEIVSRCFASHRITPRAGDLYIFPAYLQHYIASNKRGLRISLASDHHLES